MTVSRPKLGVTLYSFTPHFHGRLYSFEQLVRKSAERGLGPGLEVVGFQSIKGFPLISPEFERNFKALIDETGLELSCLGANADAGIHADRLLSEDELVEYMTAQLDAAATLGFPTVRVQYSVTPELIERLLPRAEELGITMGMEIHSPHSVHHPVMQDLWEFFERVQSPYAGFIPDWGASLTRIPPSMSRTYLAQGVPQAVIDAVEQQWQIFHDEPLVSNDDEMMVHYARMLELATANGGGDVAQHFSINAAGLFGHQRPEDWRQIMRHVVHVHGKFYDIDADGNEPSAPHEVLLRDLVEAGYDRHISTEWEGWHWNKTDDPFDMVEAQQKLSKRILDELVPA